ncbi:MAG TPA: DUF2142 domain-containing protein, partial [Candidatus Saccharimonadales bacterium]|nr:DUF2142 domain-containing protein [Candidatus Saccharimonadales bacterium]
MSYDQIIARLKKAARAFFKNPDFVIERYVLIVGLIFGLVFIFLIPPMQGADEPNHFMRAYQISEGHFTSDEVVGSRGGINPNLVNYKTPNYGGTLPMAVVDYAQATYGMHGRTRNKLTHAEFEKLLHIKIDGRTRKAAFPNTGAYSPIAYLPSATALAVGHLFSNRVMTLSYLARLSDLVVGLALIVLAIRLLPFGKLPAAVLALLPMTISQLTIISADTMAVAISFLAVALTLHYSFRKKDMNRWDIVWLVGVYVILGLNKQSLVPLALLNVGLLFNPLIRRKKAWLIAGGCLVGGLVASTAWNGLVKQAVIDGYHQTYLTADYRGQVHWLIHHPLSYLRVLYQSFFTSDFTIVPMSF